MKQKETHSYKEKETGPQRSSKHLTTFKNKIQCPSKKKKRCDSDSLCSIIHIEKHILNSYHAGEKVGKCDPIKIKRKKLIYRNRPWGDRDVRINRWDFKFKAVSINIFDDLKKCIGNLSREMEIIKKNQMEVPKLKRIMRKLKKFSWLGLTADWRLHEWKLMRLKIDQ